MAWIETKGGTTVANTDRITALFYDNLPNKNINPLVLVTDGDKELLIADIPYDKPENAGVKARKVLLTLAGLAHSNAVIKQDDIKKMLED